MPSLHFIIDIHTGGLCISYSDFTVKLDLSKHFILGLQVYILYPNPSFDLVLRYIFPLSLYFSDSI